VASARSSSSEVCSPAAVALACTTRSAFGRGRRWQRKADAERGRDLGRSGLTSTSVTSTPENPASNRATQQPTRPAPTTAIRSPIRGGASQSALTAVSTVPRERGPIRRDAIGNDDHRARGHDVGALVGVEAEHRPAEQRRRAGLDHADVEVPVLDRPREFAGLGGAAHRRVLAGRHAAAMDDQFGAAADSASDRAHQHLVGPGVGQRLRADLAHAGSRTQYAVASRRTGPPASPK